MTPGIETSVQPFQVVVRADGLKIIHSSMLVAIGRRTEEWSEHRCHFLLQPTKDGCDVLRRQKAQRHHFP